MTTQSMFFILSINVTKNTASIVGHTATLEEAIDSVKDHARAYVVAKNEPVLHRGAEGDALKFTERVHYYTKDCPDACHQIDVFRQQARRVKGWTGSSYQEDSVLVRRFVYNEYSEAAVVAAAVEQDAETMDSEELRQLRAARAREMGLRHNNTVGGVPRNVMTELRESDAFKNSAAKNRLPPPYKHNMFVDSDSEESE